MATVITYIAPLGRYLFAFIQGHNMLLMHVNLLLPLNCPQGRLRQGQIGLARHRHGGLFAFVPMFGLIVGQNLTGELQV